MRIHPLFLVPNRAGSSEPGAAAGSGGTRRGRRAARGRGLLLCPFHQILAVPPSPQLSKENRFFSLQILFKIRRQLILFCVPGLLNVISRVPVCCEPVPFKLQAEIMVIKIRNMDIAKCMLVRIRVCLFSVRAPETVNSTLDFESSQLLSSLNRLVSSYQNPSRQKRRILSTFCNSTFYINWLLHPFFDSA